MVNYDEMIQRVRRSLRDPDPHEPGDDLILQCLSDAGQELRNTSSLLGAGATQGFKVLQIGSGTAVYPLSSVPEAGRILRVHVIDPQSSPSLPRYFKIPVIERQDMGNYSEQSSGDSVPTACIVWSDTGIRQIEFIPAPVTSLTCKIWFEIGYLSVARTDAIDILPEYHHLQRLKATMAALPNCEWGALRVDDDTVPRMDRETLYSKRKQDLIKLIMAQAAVAIEKQEMKYAQYLAKMSVGGNEGSELYAQNYLDSYW